MPGLPYIAALFLAHKGKSTLFNDFFKSLLRLDDDHVIERMYKFHNVRVFGPGIAEDGQTIFVDTAPNKIQQDSGVFAARKGHKNTSMEPRTKILDGSNSVIKLLVESPALPFLQFL